MQQTIKNEIKQVEIFMLLFNGQKSRFDSAAIGMMEW